MYTSLIGSFRVYVASLCTLPIGVLGWHGQKPMLTVIVKATFSIAEDGEAKLAATQMPLSVDEPDPRGDRETLRYASDFVPRKARVDVLVVGSAHASPPARMVHAQIVVDVLEKQIVARVDNPSKFIPLARGYLRASPAADAPLASLGPLAPLVRFGPDIATLLDPDGVPRVPLGKEFDYGVFNAAPRDQQMMVLRPNAGLVLIGLARGAARRKVNLPGDRPRIFHVGASGPSDKPNEIALTADTLWIDTDTETCVVVWRGTIALAKCKEPPTELYALLERRGVARSWIDICNAVASAPRRRAVVAGDLTLADEESTSPRTVKLPPVSGDGDDEATRQHVVPGRRAPIDIEDAPTRNELIQAGDEEDGEDDESSAVTTALIPSSAPPNADHAPAARAGFGLRLGGPLGRRIAAPDDDGETTIVDPVFAPKAPKPPKGSKGPPRPKR